MKYKRAYALWWERVDSTCFCFAKPLRAAAAAPVAKNSPQDCFFNAPAQGFFIHPPHGKKERHPIGCLSFLVGEGGFEPPKVQPTDLQSAPFGHSGTLPYSVFAPGPPNRGTQVWGKGGVAE